MEPELIIKSIMGLVAILAILIFLLFLEPKKKVIKKEILVPNEKLTKNEKFAENKKLTEDAAPISQEKTNTDLESLVKIIKNKRADAEEISQTLDLIIKHHGKVHKKIGLKTHHDFDTYMDIFFTICRHPNANKDLIIKFDRELEELNPEYKKEINDAITKGLNSRRV